MLARDIGAPCGKEGEGGREEGRKGGREGGLVFVFDYPYQNHRFVDMEEAGREKRRQGGRDRRREGGSWWVSG
jgi:hypothetical protein